MTTPRLSQAVAIVASLAAVWAQQLIAQQSCSSIGLQNTAVLLVTFPGVTPPTGVTAQSVTDIFFGSIGPSLDGFWRENSNGLASASGSVRGWYTLSQSYACADMNAMRDEAINLASHDVNFQNVTRLFIIHPNTSCTAGFAQSGCSLLNYPGGTFLASTAYLLGTYMADRVQGVHLATHEGGHNLGLGHAGARDFGTEPLGPLGVSGTIDEIGDPFSTMSASTTVAHYGAPHKASLGWLSSGTNYLTVQNSGTYTLQPVETSPAGLQALRIQRGTGNNAWLWLEYRQPTGDYDSGLFSQVYSGALIHYEDSYTGSMTNLLDFTRSTSSFSDPALAAGSTWTDPYTNLSINVMGASANGLSVLVSYGAAPSCTHANPLVSLSPPDPTASPGQDVSYSMSVTNVDSSSCAASTFQVSSSLPSGWLTLFSAALLSLNPGQTGTLTMTKTVPAGASPATYAVDATGAAGSYSGTGLANSTILAPASLAASVSVDKPAYSRKETVTVLGVVTSGENPAAGATVTFVLTKPGGATATKRVTTDASGRASWSYRIGPRDPSGAYSVTAAAAWNGQTASSPPAAFQVN